MCKQHYKGFTLYVNATHFGVEHVVKGNTTYHAHERPIVAGFTSEQHLDYLKFELDVEEAVTNLIPKGTPEREDVYRIEL